MENDKDILIQKFIHEKDRKLIKQILKTFSKREFYQICKTEYRLTEDWFFLKSIKRIDLFYYFKSYAFQYSEKRQKAKDEKILAKKLVEFNNILNSIAEPEKSVYILQRSFFDPSGKNYFSGGGERYACDLAKLIKEQGYSPILIQQGEEDKDVWIRKFQDLTVVALNLKERQYLKAVNRIQSPALTIYSGCVNWAGKKSHTPSILISHGITWDMPLYNACISCIVSALSLADTIVSVDTNTISWFRSTYSKIIQKNNIKMKYIPNYVDLDKYSASICNKTNEPLKILFPRRCSPERGFWLFAELIPELLLTFDNISIDLVGFAHTEEISNKIKSLQKEFPNKVNHFVCAADKMNEVYKSADITLIPTLYSEGTSLSCIEAMASGNAVIATDVGGLPNLIINNYNGLLISPDKESLFEAIKKVVLDKELRYKLQSNAVSVSKEFSQNVWENSWRKVLSEHLNTKNSMTQKLSVRDQALLK